VSPTANFVGPESRHRPLKLAGTVKSAPFESLSYYGSQMGYPAIIEKLRNELRLPIRSERQVVYILVELRKLMDLNKDGAKFFALKFYCDWAVHSHLDHAGAQTIVKRFNIFQRFIDDIGRASHGQRITPVDSKVLDELEATVQLSKFNTQFREYLELHHLNASVATKKNRWVNFLTYYCAVIEDCPLQCSGKNLKYTDEVVTTVIHSKRKPITAADIKLVIEWQWRAKSTGILNGRQSFF
jgi:hypothetical protein